MTLSGPAECQAGRLPGKTGSGAAYAAAVLAGLARVSKTC
jgi:hypothetical protein